MTAQMETFKSDSNSATDLIGQNWQKLIDLIESRPEDAEAKSFDGGGVQRPLRTDDNFLRALQDVKRLRQKDMPLFGHCPETDSFYTVVCSSCSMILMPHALKDHYDKRHGENEKEFAAAAEKQALEQAQIKSKSRRVTPVKLEKGEKPRKTKSGSGSEMTDEALKDQKRSEKSKKLKMERAAPPEIESAPLNSSQTPKMEKLTVRQKNGSTFRFQPQLNVPLSPMAVTEMMYEPMEGKDLPKRRQREKKKYDRKTDKIFDPDKHCGVINELGKPCVRSIQCKVHQVALKRAVPNRSMTYDMLVRVMRTHGDDEKVKIENGLFRPKIEPYEREPYEREVKFQIPAEGLGAVTKPWISEHGMMGEPPIKRLKIKKEVIVDEEGDQGQFALPSHLEALIDETLRTLKEVEENESDVPMLPIPPKPEPVVKWNAIPPPWTEPPPPPQILLDDVSWHSSHPKPLATNTFGCRLIGGLMSTCKKLDTLRKHLQSVWTAAPSATSSNASYKDGHNPNNKQNGCATNVNMINNFTYSKFVMNPSTPSRVVTPVVRKTVPSPTTKSSSTKRKRRTSTSTIVPAQNTSNASDIISGLLIGNTVPIQRPAAAAVPTIPTGVIPVNSITGNSVPLRLFQGPLPVIASTAPSQSATYIQLNLCPK